MSVPTPNNPDSTPDTASTGSAIMQPPGPGASPGTIATAGSQLPPPAAAPGDFAPNAPISATGAPAGKLPANPTAPAAVPVQKPVQTVKHHVAGILRSVLNTLGESLGGPSEVQGYGPNGETTDAEGNPIMQHRGTGQRIMSALGKEMVGISAGMGQARGPGGIGRAAAAASEAVLELQEKNKMYSMQMHVQHANDLAVYRHSMAEDGVAYDKNKADHAGFVDLIKGSNKAIAVNDGQPMSFKDASEYMGQMLQQGWKVGDLLQFAGPKEPNAPSPNNPQGIGYHPTFYVFRANRQTPPGGESLAQQKVTVENAALAKKMMVAEGSQVPLYLAAKVGTEDVALNNGAQVIKRSLETAGINTDKLPQVPTDPMERQKDAAAMQRLMKQKDWQPGGDVAPAFRELQVANPDMADRVSKYFGTPDNIWKSSENLRLAQEKREAINKNPELALAVPEYRAMMAKDIGLSKYLDTAQKQTYMDQMAKIPEMTVTQAGTFMNMVYGEDFKAMQAKVAADAKTQAATDARLMREQEERLKNGEQPTEDDLNVTRDAIGEARVPMTPSMWRNPQGQHMINLVTKEFPSFTAADYPAYEKMRISFLSGKDALTLGAMSTVTKHIARMYDNVSDASTGVRGRVQGFFNLGKGGAGAQALQADVTGISTELDKAYTQGVPTIQGIEEWTKTVDTQGFAQTPAKVHERLAEAMELLRGQITTEAEKWQRGMPRHKDGTPSQPPIPLVSDEFRAAYTKITGKQVDEWGNNPASNTKVTAPNSPRDLQGHPLKPGTYVVVDGKYYDPENPKIKAAIAAGWKPDITTVKGE